MVHKWLYVVHSWKDMVSYSTRLRARGPGGEALRGSERLGRPLGSPRRIHKSCAQQSGNKSGLQSWFLVKCDRPLCPCLLHLCRPVCNLSLDAAKSKWERCTYCSTQALRAGWVVGGKAVTRRKINKKNICIYTYIYIYIYIYICVYMEMSVYIYIYIYMYIHLPLQGWTRCVTLLLLPVWFPHNSS